MRWQKPLRWGVAIAGLGFAALLVSRYQRRAPVPVAPVPPKMQAGASFQSSMAPGGRQVRYKGETEVGSWSYEKLVEFADGRRVIEKPRWDGDRAGKPYVVTADRAELEPGASGPGTNGIPEATHLIGNVIMREQDGMEVRTEDAIYRVSVETLEVPGPVTFSDRRLSGNGIGATYDRNAQLLMLKDQAGIAIAPDEIGQGKLEAHAKTITVNRLVHNALLEGGATIARDRENISAVTADMHLTEDNQGVQMMELRQQSAIVPVGGVSKTPEMHGDDITLEFLPDGRTIKRAQLLRNAALILSGDTGRKQIGSDTIDVQLGSDGQTVTGLNGTGGVTVTLPASGETPKRTIIARELTASGDGNEKHGLTSAVFKAPPPPSTERLSFEEVKPASRSQAATKRKVRAVQLTLVLNGGDLSNIKEARFHTRTGFENGDTSGDADDLIYEAASSRLEMRTIAGGKKASVTSGRILFIAQTIKMDLDKTIIDAVGEATTQTSPDEKPSSKGIFDESKVVFGNADSLRFEDATHVAVYTGKAKIGQKDGSHISGDKITLNTETGDLLATGKVETVFAIANPESGSKVAPVATAAKFVYTASKHLATYTGSEAERVQFDSTEGNVRAVTIELWLSNDDKELQRMVAEAPTAKNLMQARITEDRTAIGDRMDHVMKAGTFELKGNPARVIQRTVENGVEACTATIGKGMTFNKAGGDKGQGSFNISDTTLGSGGVNLKTCADWTIK
jgi:lipopolysaccharide export system protein LptA